MEYEIIYTKTALDDITEKYLYIVKKLHDRQTAERWYKRLIGIIQSELSFMPGKYSVYDVIPWNKKGIHLMITRQDVIMYSYTDKTVYIHAVCTAGRDLSAHLESTFNHNEASNEKT